MRKYFILLVLLFGFVLPAFGQEESLQLFTPLQDNPIIPREQEFVNPGAVLIHDGTFHMYRNGFGRWPGKVNINHLTSDDLKVWDVDEGYVVPGGEVPYSQVAVMSSSVIVEDDGTWVMYFYTVEDYNVINPGRIGRATAPSAEGPWVIDQEPVLDVGSPGEWDSLMVGWPSVTKLADTYYMFYTGIADFSGLDSNQMGMATSTDGIHWEKYNNPETTEAPYLESDPILGRKDHHEWDKYGGEIGRVVFNGEQWVMLYKSRGSISGLGIAISDDGIHWERQHQGPVFQTTDIPNGRGFYDYNFVYDSESQTYYLFIEIVRIDEQVTNVYALTAETLLE